ncbi:MAG: hypothetical protein IJX69_06065 [Oscillospiraceae bacterium]|nr:hypothetical protein [Oscillospiraceae bacterium]
MERIGETRPRGINRNGLHTWAILLALTGLVGRGLLQGHILGIGSITSQELLDVMNSSQDMMIIATLSLVLQVLETCAVPLFALMLAEGFVHTSSRRDYVLRVAGCALISEIPYDLAMKGKLFDFSSQNPVFGMVLSLVLLYLFSRFEGKGFVKFIIRLAFVFCAVIWTEMLSIDLGAGFVLVVWPMYVFRDKPLYRNLVAAAMSMVGMTTSLFFVMAPMGCLMLHFYNGEQGDEEPNRIIKYLTYPALALAVGLVGMFVL